MLFYIVCKCGIQDSVEVVDCFSNAVTEISFELHISEADDSITSSFVFKRNKNTSDKGKLKNFLEKVKM